MFSKFLIACLNQFLVAFTDFKEILVQVYKAVYGLVEYSVNEINCRFKKRHITETVNILLNVLLVLHTLCIECDVTL